MSYFLSPHPLQPGQIATLEGEEAAHLLKSRRLRSGDRFALQDPAGRRFSAEVTHVDRHSATVRVLDSLPVPAPPALRLTLLLGAVKEKALEFALQKVTELGAAEILVFPAEYSPADGDELTSPKTLVRWERILREACKQSDRQFPPALRTVPTLAVALEASRGAALRLALDPRAEASLAALVAQAGAIPSAALLIGPEGGLTPTEVAHAQGEGFRPTTFGELILRADTAAVAATAVLLLGRAGMPG
jgi:16S rRNA (uracil1498-N3)-methyltransferase